jgi:hypothetical protein
MRACIRGVLPQPPLQRRLLLTGIGQRVYVDIDSLLRRSLGRHKQGASFRHAKIGRACGVLPALVDHVVHVAVRLTGGDGYRAGRAVSGTALEASSPAAVVVNPRHGERITAGILQYRVLRALKKAGLNKRPSSCGQLVGGID